MADRTERVSEETVVQGDKVVQERSVNVTDSDQPINKVSQVIWFIVGVISSLLLLRFVLALLGANPANAFANFIYELSNVFVAPFRGLLQVSAVEYGVARFEIETLVAIAVYALFGYGIIKMIQLGRKGTAA